MARPFRIERSIDLAAAPSGVFAVVSDLSRWNDWSPWYRMEPTAPTRLEGPKAGVGAVISWDGKKTGTGRMEVVSVEADRRVDLRLDFLTPMKATNQTVFALEPTPSGGTRFTWTMSGERPLLMVVIAFVLRLDRMLNGQFDDGLRQLKAIVDG
jgi:hypothetical protein